MNQYMWRVIFGNTMATIWLCITNNIAINMPGSTGVTNILMYYQCITISNISMKNIPTSTMFKGSWDVKTSELRMIFTMMKGGGSCNNT